MTGLKCNTRSHGNFLYGKKQSVFSVFTDCIIIVGLEKGFTES